MNLAEYQERISEANHPGDRSINKGIEKAGSIFKSIQYK